MILIKIARIAFLFVNLINLARADGIDLSLFDLKRLDDNVYVASQNYGNLNN